MKLGITPATVGPSAGPTAMTTEIKPITEPRREAEHQRRGVVISRGDHTGTDCLADSRQEQDCEDGAKAAMTVPMRNAEAARRRRPPGY